MILTPMQIVLSKIKNQLSDKDFFKLQKEMVNVYSAGFYDANFKEVPLRRALKEADILEEVKDEKLNKWIERVCG